MSLQEALFAVSELRIFKSLDTLKMEAIYCSETLVLTNAA
jgi:hypothetical protein